jgi:uncharacterized protein YneF (UPF0154 family)
MATFIDSMATAIMLILIVIFLLHGINGTTGSWVTSKFMVAPKVVTG